MFDIFEGMNVNVGDIMAFKPYMFPKSVEPLTFNKFSFDIIKYRAGRHTGFRVDNVHIKIPLTADELKIVDISEIVILNRVNVPD